jgi:hypothetical protein
LHTAQRALTWSDHGQDTSPSTLYIAIYVKERNTIADFCKVNFGMEKKLRGANITI